MVCCFCGFAKKVKASRQRQKEQNPDVYFMKTWDWPEIFAAYRYEFFIDFLGMIQVKLVAFFMHFRLLGDKKIFARNSLHEVTVFPTRLQVSFFKGRGRLGYKFDRVIRPKKYPEVETITDKTGNSLQLPKEPPTEDQTKKLFTTFACLGPVARTCLKSIDVQNDEKYNRSIDVYLRQVDKEIDGFIAHGGRETIEHTVYQDSSHRIAVMQPTKTGLSYTARIITKWIAYRLYEKALQQSQQDCFVLFKHLSRQTGLRSAAGSFFEGYVHDWFRLGGVFSADEIPSTNDSIHSFEFRTVKPKSSTPNYFTTAKNLATQVKATHGRGLKPSTIGKYFIPFSRNYEAVDGLLFSDLQTIVLFQMTLAKQHSIKPFGIKELLKILPKTIKKVYVVFVVPESRRSDYSRTQNLPDAEAISPPGAYLELKQFRLVFNEKDMQSVAVQGPFEMQEEEDEEDADSGCR